MIDPARKEAMEAVKLCRQIKIKPVMITGDHKLTALAVAKELGIYQEGDEVLTGEELEKISDEELEAKVRKISVSTLEFLLFISSRIVQAWKKNGEIVAMTGDGVNDAPALKKSDIGIAMGITGTEVTKESADLVLADDNFATIVNAVELGRWTYDNIKKYLTYLLQANLLNNHFSFAVLAGYPLPLVPVQILYVNLATDGFPAIALGLSPPEPDIMKRPPRDPKETIFTKDIKVFLLRAILIETPLLLGVFIGSLPAGEEIARTRLFLLLVFFELVISPKLPLT